MHVCMFVCRHVPSYIRQFRTYGAKMLLNKYPRCDDIKKEPMCTFNVDYVTRNNRRSQLRTIASNDKRVFYDCPSYRVIYVKRPHKFLRTVRMLRETSS